MLSDYSPARWPVWATGLSLACIIFIMFLELFPGQQTFTLSGQRINHEEGCAYTINLEHKQPAWPLMHYESDTLSSSASSMLDMLEDGKSVGRPHSPHDEIRRYGGSRYSHWNGTLYFSASDCSDPRSNGRTYEVSVTGSLSHWAKYIWLLAVYAFCFQIMLLTSPRKKAPYDSRVITSGLFLSLIIAGIILTARGAADIGPYHAWAHYFSTFDLSTFSGYPRSVTGVPLIQWSYGTGLLAAIPAVLVSYAGAFPIPPVGIVLGLANLGLILYIARSITGSNVQANLIMGGIILFTPAGFYLNKYSAEGWTVFLVLSGLALIEWGKKNTARRTTLVSMMLGVCFYFLLLVKIQNIVLCAGLWVIFVASNLTRPWTDRNNRVFVIRNTLILTVLSGVGLAFLLLFNHIVSDNFLKSPYDAGDTEFSMFALGNLKFVEVLISPWHGLLVYHPAIAFFVYYLLRELVMKRKTMKDAGMLIAIAGLGVMALQVVVQGSWYIWWMGIGTFGARGFAGASLILAYAFIKSDAFKLLTVSNLSRLTILVLGGYCAIMLFQEETNIVEYAGLFQLIQYGSWEGVVALIVVLQLLQVRLKHDKSSQLACLLMALAAFPVIFYGIKGSVRHIEMAGVSLLILMLLRFIYLPQAGKVVSGVLHRIIFMFVMTAFSVSVVLQILLLKEFGEEITVSNKTGHGLDCSEYVASLIEYQSIRGYEVEKKSLYDFLIRQKCI